MTPDLFFKGLVIGFSIAAPVGPIGVLCIRRTLAGGRLFGFVSGMGAATADSVYGAIAAFGLTALTDLLIAGQVWLRLVGGGFLVFLGIRTFFARPVSESAQASSSETLAGAYCSTFALTITNPLTILSFAAIFAGMGAGGEGLSAGLVVLGVFCGSGLWWLLLSGSVKWLARRVARRNANPESAESAPLPPGLLVWVNRVSGLVILAFGVWVLAGLLASPS